MIGGIRGARRLAAVALVGMACSARAQEGSRPLRDLPLTWVEPAGTPPGVVAIVLTGDGGWASFIHGVADALAARGIGVVALNSRAYLSSRRSPDSVAVAVDRMTRAALDRWQAARFVVVGYSRGADLAPFAVNRLPADLRARLLGVFMYGLATYAGFQFHWSDLVSDTRRPEDLAIMPELERLRGTPVTCVYGTEEKESGCRDASDSLVTKVAHQGGHSFGSPAAMADIVLRAIAGR